MMNIFQINVDKSAKNQLKCHYLFLDENYILNQLKISFISSEKILPDRSEYSFISLGREIFTRFLGEISPWGRSFLKCGGKYIKRGGYFIPSNKFSISFNTLSGMSHIWNEYKGQWSQIYKTFLHSPGLYNKVFFYISVGHIFCKLDRNEHADLLCTLTQ